MVDGSTPPGAPSSYVDKCLHPIACVEGGSSSIVTDDEQSFIENLFLNRSTTLNEEREEVELQNPFSKVKILVSAFVNPNFQDKVNELSRNRKLGYVVICSKATTGAWVMRHTDSVGNVSVLLTCS